MELHPSSLPQDGLPDELVAYAEHRDAGALAERLAWRARAITAGADADATLEALDALLRRLDSARGGQLVVRPGSPGTGRFRVSRRGAPARSYEVWLGDARTLEASCSCPDFGKSALGLCKHVFVVLGRRGVRSCERARPALRWDPIRPFTGPGDYLARLWWDRRASPRMPRALFQVTPEACPIEPERLRDHAMRLATVEQLLRACRRRPDLAEPAVVTLLAREHAALRRGSALSARELDRLLHGLKRELFGYQREGVARFLEAGRLLLADDMGLGKTAQAIAACHALFATGQIRRALVVVPAPLKPQWEQEWRSFTDVPIRAVDGQPEERARIYARHDRGALLVNYEQLLRDLPLVQAYAPDVAILDEAQRIKNWATKTAAIVKQIDARWRLVLTGTPMENRLDELASIMEWVDEHAIEPRWRLSTWHATRLDGGREIVGARNLETLRSRLAPVMVRRVRRDVLAQLPPRRDMRVPNPLTPAQQAAHDELDPAIAQILARARNRALTQPEFLRLMRLLTQQRMICNALALLEFDDLWPTLERGRRRTPALLAALGSPKLLELRDRIADLAIAQRRKVVVFSQWRRMLKLAAWVCGDVLARDGARSVFFTGEESQRRRTENIMAFHDDPDARVLFATDAGGVGLNLQRASSCCINLELPWNPAVLEQRIGRIYRLGQDQPVDIYNLVAASGIEDRIACLVGDKRALFAGLFDGTSDEVPFDSAGSFLTRVHEIVRPDAAPTAVATEAADSHERDDLDRLDEQLEAPEAPEARDAPEPAAPVGSPAPLGSSERVSVDVADLVASLSQLTLRPLDNGRLALELPRPAAAALGGLLRAFAATLDGAPG